MDELAGLPEDVRKLALDRFRLVQPHLEQNQSLQSVAQAAGIPYRTAQRWVAQYRLSGLVALARKKRGDRGERRAVSAKVKEVIEALRSRSPHFQLQHCTVRYSGWRLTWAQKRRATERSSISSAICPLIF
ncbi:MAG: helix-turn-helix domain-containing protein [Acidobacteriia bacterium]|nr:helix-turn-helix domain-containing protein [Terriglobia bacterium]